MREKPKKNLDVLIFAPVFMTHGRRCAYNEAEVRLGHEVVDFLQMHWHLSKPNYTRSCKLTTLRTTRKVLPWDNGIHGSRSDNSFCTVKSRANGRVEIELHVATTLRSAPDVEQTTMHFQQLRLINPGRRGA
jgi:hypothetical protein